MATVAAKQKSTSYTRDGLDWYVEPRWCDDLFFTVEKPPGPIWDPASGDGNIPSAAHDAGHRVFATDKVYRVLGEIRESWLDFLKDDIVHIADNAGSIVTNPPYRFASDFVVRARQIVPYVAVLVRLDFLASQRRKQLVSEAARVWVMSKRPSMPPGQHIIDGGKVGSGQHDYCWIVWDQTHSGQTQIGWLS